MAGERTSKQAGSDNPGEHELIFTAAEVEDRDKQIGVHRTALKRIFEEQNITVDTDFSELSKGDLGRITAEIAGIGLAYEGKRLNIDPIYHGLFTGLLAKDEPRPTDQVMAEAASSKMFQAFGGADAEITGFPSFEGTRQVGHQALGGAGTETPFPRG